MAETYNHAIIASKKHNELISLTDTNILLRWTAEEKPKIITQKEVGFKSRLKFLDDDNFIILDLNTYKVEIWDWANLECLKRFSVPSRSFNDALYLPLQKGIICGGGWDVIYFLDLETEKFIKCHNSSDEFEYISLFAMDNSEQYFIHSDTSTFHNFYFNTFNHETKHVEQLGYIEADTREHKDVFLFLPDRKVFIHVLLDCYTLNVITFYSFEADKLRKLESWKLPMIKHKANCNLNYYWHSSIILHPISNKTILIAAGQQIIEFHVRKHSFDMGRHYFLENITLDMVELNKEIYLATNKGVERYNRTRRGQYINLILEEENLYD